MERVVLEGATDSFHQSVNTWRQTHRIDGNVAVDGISVTLTVSRKALNKIRKLLTAPGTAIHPGGLYRAYLPAPTPGGIPQIVRGHDYDSANSRLESAPGRHVRLAALPSDLARLARRKTTNLN